MSENATARPWRIGHEEVTVQFAPGLVSTVCDCAGFDDAQANVALIVEAVNSHDFLKSRSELFEEMAVCVSWLLAHKEGALPTSGWLRDNDNARAAVDKLESLISRIRGEV